MSVSMNSGAAAISAKHRNAEGTARVLGQTAAVAGISGALLLALKAMVLVSPAVLPHGADLDALGRPAAVAPVEAPAAPVTFEPASANTPVGHSERSITRSVSIPTTITKGGGTTTPSKPVQTPQQPGDPGQGQTPPVGGLPKTTKPVTDLLDGVVPGVGGTVDGLVKTVDGTVKSLPVAGPAVGGLVDTVGQVAAPVTTTVTGTVTNLTDSLGVTDTGANSGGLLGLGLLGGKK